MDLPGLLLVAGIQIDGIGRTDLDALPAARAGILVDEQHLRGVVRDRLVDGLALRQPVVERIVDLHRADVDALPHLVANGRIDEAGPFQQLDLVVAPVALDRRDRREGHNLDVFMEQALAHAVLRRIFPAHERQHAAHAAVVRRELVVELGQDPPDLGGIIGQDNLVA